MNKFFCFSSFKIKITAALVAYILIGAFLFTSYATTGRRVHSESPREINALGTTLIVTTAPAMFLSLPFAYVFEKIFLNETTLNEIMIKNGCTNCTDKRYDEPIPEPSAFGFAAGLIVEISLLYTLACFFSFIFIREHKHKGKRT